MRFYGVLWGSAQKDVSEQQVAAPIKPKFERSGIGDDAVSWRSTRSLVTHRVPLFAPRCTALLYWTPSVTGRTGSRSHPHEPDVRHVPAARSVHVSRPDERRVRNGESE